MAKPKPFCCPSCGHPLGDRYDPNRLVDHLPITGNRRAFLRILCASFAREVETALIIDIIYGGPDGGPLAANKCIGLYAFELRKLLAPYGLTIVGRKCGGPGKRGSYYRLDWLDAPAIVGQEAVACV